MRLAYWRADPDDRPSARPSKTRRTSLARAVRPDGASLLVAADRFGFEGVVSKRADAPYRSGRCRDWVKVKTDTWREQNKDRWRLFAA